jgi:hypothetical protein
MCDYKSFQDGVGEVKFKTSTANVSFPKETLLTVVLVCPRCHKRTEVEYDVWIRSELPKTPAHEQFLCKNIICEGKKMIYHKMGGE